jgi:two-component system response regulator HydG
MKRILMLDPALPVYERLAALLEQNGFTAVRVADLDEFRREADRCAAAIVDVRWQRDSLTDPSTPVIILDGSPTIRAAVAAVKAGAADYLPLDAPDGELIEAVQTAAAAANAGDGIFPMVGSSPPMQALFDSIAKVAVTESTVLITGESGTGKELVARAIHAAGKRRHAPLISLNCTTVPDDLIEAELFGHPGEESRGLLAAAEGGTLFLDEVGELPPAVQSRLLRALETEQNVRLISATHRDLEKLVASGQFRDDLYYRLKVVSLTVPPLRERGDDVLLLADAVLSRTAEKLGKRNLSFTRETREDILRYPWPGNVRELENAIQRAVILCDDQSIDTRLLAIELPQEAELEAGAASPDQTLEDYFVSFVTAHQDSMTEIELAKKLGISRKSLWERRQRLNIPRKKTKKRGRRRDVS